MSRVLLRSAGFALALCAVGSVGCAAPSSEDAAIEHGADALVSSAPPVRATGVSAWIQRIEDNAAARSPDALEKYTECAEVEELRGAFLCGAYSTQTMNRALARATLYAEGLFGHPRGTVVATNAGTYRTALRMLAGHDLRSEHLLAFWKAAEEACAAEGGEAYCPDDDEKDYFETYILPMAEVRPDFVVITFALTGYASPMEIVTHEILHAQYFLQPAFREGTDSYWESSVPESDRAAMTAVIGQHYDVSDPLLLRNEFMAYVLMRGAETNLLRLYVPTHRQPLLDTLAESGAAPLDVR